MLAIRAIGPKQSAGTLSGGNQQKVVIGKWLATAPRVLLLDEPTRGIDVGAKAEIYRLIRELSAQGIAILVASSEMPELLALSDRILVLREGRPTALLRHARVRRRYHPGLRVARRRGAGAVRERCGPAGSAAPPSGQATRISERRAEHGDHGRTEDCRPARGVASRGGALGGLRFLLSTKLYWGLALLLLLGVALLAGQLARASTFS